MSWWYYLETMKAYVPVDLATMTGMLSSLAVMSFFIILRYFIIVGSFYLYLYKGTPKARKLHDLKISKNQYRHEIKWSLISTIIFASSGYLMGLAWQLGYTQIYLEFDKYTLWYLPLSFVTYTLIHEFYFYFTHLWMHKPKWYKRVHHVHHLSHKVSPWASFSFHPWECLVHAAFLPFMVLIIPVHPLMIITYLTFMTFTAVSNHSGFELIKSKWIKSWFISGEHHFLHHHYYNGNYGLFFTFIDKVFNTELTPNNKDVSVEGELV